MAADDDECNEIIAAARAAKHHHEAASGKPEPSRKRNWDAAAIGVGAAIGSAAVAAAVIFANRGKKK